MLPAKRESPPSCWAMGKEEADVEAANIAIRAANSTPRKPMKYAIASTAPGTNNSLPTETIKSSFAKGLKLSVRKEAPSSSIDRGLAIFDISPAAFSMTPGSLIPSSRNKIPSSDAIIRGFFIISKAKCLKENFSPA